MDEDQLAWETIEQTTAYQCPGFEIVNETVRLPDGSSTDFDYLSEPAAVVILPVTPDNEIVTIREWREPVKRVNWGLPVGTIDPGESPTDAAHRELTEETGYEADAVEQLVTLEPVNGVADSVHHYYLATNCTPTAEQDLDADEQIYVETTAFETLQTAALQGNLRDGRATTAVCWYALATERNP